MSLSTDMNIVFWPKETTCATAMVWRISDTDRMTRRRYVTVGSVAGNSGPSTWRNWFKTRKVKIITSLCSVPRCADTARGFHVGMWVFFEEVGYKWLGLSDVPYPVMFDRAVR